MRLRRQSCRLVCGTRQKRNSRSLWFETRGALDGKTECQTLRSDPAFPLGIDLSRALFG
jgi:hypothetical protein